MPAAIGSLLAFDHCHVEYFMFPAWSNTLVEIDHEIISTAILLPSAVSRRVVVSYKGK